MATLPEFEALVDKAIKCNLIPGVVAIAKDKSGKLSYTHASGSASLDPSFPKPMTPRTIFALASLTKLITTVALLQLVDRGTLTLDTDITPFVPDLASQPILSPSSTPSNPTFTKRTTPITLRHLLTHTSGLTYPFLTPALAALKSQRTGSTNPFSGRTLTERYAYPLLFEPGTAFQMGPGIDFAGAVLEAVTGMDLEGYLAQHVLLPLGLERDCMTFRPHRVAGLVESERFARIAVRNAEGKVEFAPGQGEMYLVSEQAFGGEGLYADLVAYGEVLQSLLLDDGRLLSSEMVGRMFEGAIPTEEAKGSLARKLETPDWVIGVVPEREEYDWGLGGLWTGRGQLRWGGMFNMAWFIDREAGVFGVFGTQVLPPRDPMVKELMARFEEEVYRTVTEL